MQTLVRHLPGLGTLQGEAQGSVTVFRGVPYAAQVRFRPPQPPVAWRGVRDATRNGPIAPQPRLRAMEAILGPVTAPQDEDCLTLNIWAPAQAAKAPVLVWIHGGGFLSGAGSLPWYDGRHLAERHGLVVVALNYRLGALGFLPIPQGNLGLLDQIAALGWVQQYIEVFGGDPDRVTVAGQSGGAHNITSMLAIPQTKGLFRRAILQSPPLGIGLLSQEEASERGRRLLSLAPGPLEALTIRELLGTQLKVMGLAPRGDLRPPFLPDEGPPHDFPGGQLIQRAAARKVDLLLGWTRDEANLYGPGQADLTETLFAAPCRALASAVGGAFLYRFDWQSQRGACHCLDIPFALGTWRAWMDMPLLAGARQAEVEALSEEMMGCWASFVANGDPGFASGPLKLFGSKGAEP